MICKLERDGSKDVVLCREVLSDYNYYEFSVDVIMVVTDRATMVFDVNSFTSAKIDTIIINPKVAILEDNNGKTVLKVIT